ncbi:Ubiquitin carboxyl-terminal hydrolase 26 [Cymbomonas tetramitiformis]|uniref:ubiquitinyl hydrolase 1 n=1 Tax=Cymbomonas tetramitiformis TaxID=36881 RepID=A0AAE0LFF7_9CHLO|nr:Ubiquitin carboxyl-terminal hydrolase 26 [Cymbomonas tetramitiformis]|eukprot:gene7179-8558_t
MKQDGTASLQGTTRGRKTSRVENTSAIDVTQIFRREDITNEVRLAAYGIENSCAKPDACTGIKSSPNCLHGLVPKQGSYRKKGLWTKHPESLRDLGEDPSTLLRESNSTPAGLKNLGATCYVNSALQCLFMNLAFRRGVFCAEETLAREGVLLHLRRLFAELSQGERYFVDPSGLAQALELDNGVQQDGQEFMKLLLSLLESILGHSHVDHVARLVKSLFGGTFAYATTCEKCGQDSENSRNAVDFYELELNVKGFGSLGVSLEDFLSTETLSGDNQYFCDNCLARVDATRRLRLLSLPKVLKFQLKRFVFDCQTFERRKVQDAFSFPLELDLRARIHRDTQEEAVPADASEGHPSGKSGQYELSAILLHKGTNSTSGHYVAHVRCEETQKWWKFDDEAVTLLGDAPFGEASAAKSLGKAAGKRGKAVAGGEKEVVEAGHVTSKEAYLLIYREKRQEGTEITTAPTLPPDLELEVQRCNSELHAMMEEFHQRSEHAGHTTLERQAEVRRVLSTAPLSSGTSTGAAEEGYRWIDFAWLEGWANSAAEVPRIDNNPLLCEHGNADPAKVQQMKRISVLAWEELQHKYGGGPELSQLHCCDACLVARNCTSQQRNNVLAMAAAALDASAKSTESGGHLGPAGVQEELGPMYLVSRTWLMAWVRRPDKAPATGTTLAAAATAPLTCPHSGLLPESSGSGARRAVLPAAVWEYLQSEAAAGGEPMDLERAATEGDREEAVSGAFGREAMETCGTTDGGGSATPEVITMCEIAAGEEIQEMPPKSEGGGSPVMRPAPVFMAGAPDCAQCAATLCEKAVVGQRSRDDAILQREALGDLLAVTSPALQPGENYYVLPTGWVQQWRSFVGGASARSSKAPTAPPPALTLEEAVAELLCNHGRGRFPAPVVTRHRSGHWMQRDAEADPYVLLTELQWAQLSSFFQPSRNDVVANLQVVEQEQSAGAAGVGRRKRGRSPAGGAKALGGESGNARLCFKPEVCTECLEEQQERERLAAANYSNATISVHVVHRGKQKKGHAAGVGAGDTGEPPWWMVSSGGRARERSRRGQKELTVNSDLQLKALKLLIWGQFNVHPEDMELWCRERVVGGAETQTLGESEIGPGECITVVAGNDHDPNDETLLASMDDSAAGRPTGPERGFQGTGLLGQWPALAKPSHASDNDEATGSGIKENHEHDIGSGQVDSHAAEQIAFVAKQWTCKHCTLMNSMSDEFCNVCDQRRQECIDLIADL